MKRRKSYIEEMREFREAVIDLGAALMEPLSRIRVAIHARLWGEFEPITIIPTIVISPGVTLMVSLQFLKAYITLTICKSEVNRW